MELQGAVDCMEEVWVEVNLGGSKELSNRAKQKTIKKKIENRIEPVPIENAFEWKKKAGAVKDIVVNLTQD